MTKNNECALCKRQTKTQKSHIIPKFFGKWIKDTSATGYLRDVINPNIRRQDLNKIPLLCKDCEEIFSKYETIFIKEIFLPFQNGVREFSYSEWLIKFVISIAWRVGICKIKEDNDNKILPPKLRNEVINALNIWRNYLLGYSKNRGKFKSHIFFIDIIKSVGEAIDLHDNTNMYLLRATDLDIAYNNEMVFIYIKLPAIIMVTHIYPVNMKGWRNTRIYNRGKLKIPQKCNLPGFVEFLNSRIKQINLSKDKISDVQVEKINKKAMQDFERLKNSKTIEALMADIYLKEIKNG